MRLASLAGGFHSLQESNQSNPSGNEANAGGFRRSAQRRGYSCRPAWLPATDTGNSPYQDGSDQHSGADTAIRRRVFWSSDPAVVDLIVVDPLVDLSGREVRIGNEIGSKGRSSREGSHKYKVKSDVTHCLRLRDMS